MDDTVYFILFFLLMAMIGWAFDLLHKDYIDIKIRYNPKPLKKKKNRKGDDEYDTVL